LIELVDRLAEQSKKKKAKEKVKAEKKSDVLICDFCDCVKPITEAINVGVKEMMTTVIETQKEAEASAISKTVDVNDRRASLIIICGNALILPPTPSSCVNIHH